MPKPIGPSLPADLTRKRTILPKNDFTLYKQAESLRHSDPQAAISRYLQVLRTNPQDPFTLSGLGLTYKAMGNHPKAIKYLERCIEIEPKNKIVLSALADSYSIIEDFQNAIAHLKTILDLNKADPHNYYLLGRCYHSTGKIPEAIKSLRKSLELDRSFYKAAIKLAAIYQKQQIYRAAIQYYTMALESTPENGRIKVRIAECNEMLGEIDTAREKISEQLQSTPNDIPLLKKRVAQLIDQEEFLAAEALLRQVLEADQSSKYWAGIRLADCLYRLGRLDEALETIDRLEKNDYLNTGKIKTIKGDCLLRKLMRQEATIEYKAALESESLTLRNIIRALIGLGRVHIDMGRAEQNPDDAMKQLETGKKYLFQALRQNTRKSQKARTLSELGYAHYHLAKLCTTETTREHLNLAKKYFKEAIRLAPRKEVAKRGLSKVEGAISVLSDSQTLFRR